MNYIFLDMEWNQPSGKAEMITSPVSFIGEIIRIGAVKVNEDMTPCDTFRCSVIPRYYKKMNSSVSRVTGLKSASITYGVRFEAAYRSFLSWCGKDCVILAWGGEDERVLSVNLAIHKMEVSYPKFYDLQQIFAYRAAGDGKQYSLTAALEYCGLPCELKTHDAMNDAEYCARIGISIGFSRYLDGYEQMLSEARQLKEEKYTDTFTNVPGKREALSDKRIAVCRCPFCKRAMTLTPWEHYGENCEAACCKCSLHGEYFARLRIKRCRSGGYTVTRRLARLTPEYRALYERITRENAEQKTEP